MSILSNRNGSTGRKTNLFLKTQPLGEKPDTRYLSASISIGLRSNFIEENCHTLLRQNNSDWQQGFIFKLLIISSSCMGIILKLHTTQY